MQTGQLFFNTVTLTSPDAVNKVFKPGTVLTISHEIDPGIWEASTDSATFVVTPDSGIAVDADEINVDLFRRAVALGYRLDPSYFAPGYNRLMEFKLDLSDKRCGFMMNSDEALELAIVHQANLDILDPHREKDRDYAVRLIQSRDDALAYAERLEQFERLVKTYIKDQTV